MHAEPLIEWSEPVMELIGFIAIFLTAGAIGFRYSSLRGRLGRGGVTADAGVYETAARRAAMLGLLGALVAMARMVQALPNLAQRAHTTTGALLSSNLNAQLMIGFGVLALIGFLLASGRLSIGWPLAAIGVVAGALRGLFSGRWAQLVNPMHELAAGLWIGTLFVLVIVGLALVLREETPADRRGPIAAGMIHDFSPLALLAGGLVVLFGVITAWRHLNPLSSLWTTPYGLALIAKLLVVAVVFALGAWNWKRGRPALGSEAGARGVKRSATKELAAAGLVLVITAILVSLPSPRRPGAGGPPGGPAPGEGPPPAAAPAPGIDR